jgi:phytoene/squalene synthetase
MEMDLKRTQYDPAEFKEYIVGSAEVVGLMCLKVFCNGDEKLYHQLTPAAMSLGSAFQKINFLRDIKADYFELGRSYFPGVAVHGMGNHDKKQIEEDIKMDFKDGLNGIKKLPKTSRFGVYLAYVYFYALFRKIRSVQAGKILTDRIRIPDYAKLWLLIRSLFYYHLKLM